MFRIHYDWQSGTFIIQIGIWGGLFWKTVMRKIKGPGDDVSEVIRFDTFEKAINYVNQIGLNTLYLDKSANKYRQHLAIA